MFGESFERKYDIAAMLANTHQSCSVIYLKPKVNIRHLDYIIDDLVHRINSILAALIQFSDVVVDILLVLYLYLTSDL